MPMHKGIKARPHDLAQVMTLNPELIEIHASSEDLSKTIEGQYDVPLVVHFPEYDGTELLDPASDDENKRLQAETFYQRALDKTREWATHFRGTPKAILHPGGWSSEPVTKTYIRNGLYDNFHRTWSAFNRKGIDLLVENMPPFPIYYGGMWNSSIFMDPRETRDYAIGNGYGVCVDVCHAALYCNHIKNINIMDFIKHLRPVMAHAHISDATGVAGEGIQIGEGEMPLAEIINYLNPIQIGVVPEVWFGHRDNFQGFKLAWERLNAMVKEPMAA